MSKIRIRQVYDDYCRAIRWVEATVEKVPPNPRMYVYRDILQKEVLDFENGIELSTSTPEETNAILEANLESAILIDVHKQFGGRREKEFVDKLRESQFGPVYSNDEQLGKGPTKSAFARDIQSELLLATRSKRPEIVTFDAHDIVYDLGDQKFGIECKRIHSEKQIFSRFHEACSKLQTNPGIGYGLVALRFDKFYFQSVPGSELLELAVRNNSVLRTSNEKTLGKAARFQTLAFRARYGRALAEQGLQYDKVCGVCAFIHIPCLLGQPSIPYNVGQSLFNFWDRIGPDRKIRKRAYTRLARELDYPFSLSRFIFHLMGHIRSFLRL